MVFLGIDWVEAHHDVCLLDEQGKVLGKRRVVDGLEGVRRLHELVAEHASEPEQVVVGIETDRGLLVQALLAASYQIYAINPLAVSRYRERHATSGAKSDPADAKLMADLVRTDRHNHRPLAGDSQLAEAVKVLARAQQNLIWSRQRQVNQLRSLLREFYPAALEAFGGDLAGAVAIAILERAPTPYQGRSISQAKLVAALRKAGRERNLEVKAAEIQACLRQPQLEAAPLLTQAYGRSVTSLVHLVRQLNQELSASFELHPDAEIYLSLPGLGKVLGARVMAEFGDDRTRFENPKARKSFAGTAPITKASGRRKTVLRRFACNHRLLDACYWWAFASLRRSPGASHYSRRLRARGQPHRQALRALANRLVGILDGCLRHRQLYREEVAWPRFEAAA